MWNKIVEFQRKYDVQVRWFFIGTFVQFFIRDLMDGDYLWALIDLFFIFLNAYSFNDR
jgi:hypothetical protein